MRNIPYLCWVLLFANGVSGVEEVHLMVGDSVTLNGAVSEIPSNERIQWQFGTTRIAEINGKPKYYDVKDFKDQLELNETGSLKIKSINTKHSGEYKQNIGGKDSIPILKLIVTDGVKSVSVMKGDSVTLHTGVTVKSDAKWTFENEDLTDQTGDLTITNISSHQSGNYSLEINNSRMGIRRTYVVVVIDEKSRVSVKEGKNVVLVTGLKDFPPYGLILNTEGRTFAKINKNDNSGNNIRDARLLLDYFSGSLIISDSTTTDTGVYSLTINSSTYSLQRTINVTVSIVDSGVAAGPEAGIIVGLLAFLWCLQL